MLPMQRKILVMTLLAAALGVRLWFAWNYDETLYADAIFQSKEVAHKIVFDRGHVPWEYHYDATRHHGGVRSILHPLVYVPPLYIADQLGFSWSAILKVVKLGDALISFAVIWVFYQLSLLLVPRREISWLVLLLCGFSGLMISYGNQSFSNVLVCPLLYAAMSYFVGDLGMVRLSWRSEPMLRAGLFAGLATMLRPDIILFLGVFALLYHQTTWRLLPVKLGYFALGFVASGVVFATALDYLWYQDFLLTSWNNFYFNAISDGGVRFVDHEQSWYLQQLLFKLPGFGALLAFMLGYLVIRLNLWRWLPAPRPYLIPWEHECKPLAYCVLLVLLASQTRNQQLRFLFPLLPFFLLALATATYHLVVIVATAVAPGRWRRFAGSTSLAVALAIFGWSSGRYFAGNPPGHYQDLFQALTWVGDRDDLKGAVFFGSNFWSTAYFHYHAALPFKITMGERALARALAREEYNYLVVPQFRLKPLVRSIIRSNGFAEKRQFDNRTVVFIRDQAPVGH